MTVDEFKAFLEENRETLINNAIDISDLPEDDEWIQDDIWDEIYEREVLSVNGTK